MIFVWDYEFSHPPREVWRLVADTDQLYRSLGFPAVEFTHEPDHRGGMIRFGSFRYFGLKFLWREQAYEFIRNRFFQVDRNFESGPLNTLRSQWRIFETPYGCRLQTTFHAEASVSLYQLPVGLYFQFILKRRMFRVYRGLARYLEGKSDAPYPRNSGERTVEGRTARMRLAARFAAEGVAQDLAEVLSGYVLTGPFREVSRMRPAELARRWNHEENDIFRALLKLTRKHYLRLYFELLCASCRRPLGHGRRLSEMPLQGYCEICNEMSIPHLQDTLHVSFAPTPSLRFTQVPTHCIGGPGNIPHYEAQLLLQSETNRAIELILPAGKYRMRSPHSSRTYAIIVSDEHGTVERPLCSFPPPGDPRPGAVIPDFGSGRVGLFLRNEMYLEILSILEDTALRPDDLPALHVLARQDFYELFPTTLPRGDSEMPAGVLTLVVISGAEDPEAILDIVRERNGRLMDPASSETLAVFVRSADAMAAALELRQQALDGRSSGPRVAIHPGQVFAVNEGERLDFRGRTVDIVARLNRECRAGEILFTVPVLKDRNVRSVLKAAGVAGFARGEVSIPQFDRPLPVFRLALSS